MDLLYPILGVRLFIWLIFFLALGTVIGTLAYWRREDIRRVIYTLGYSESVIKVYMHYPGGQFKVYYRLVPVRKIFQFGNQTYKYEDSSLVRQNCDTFAVESDGNFYMVMEGKRYILNRRYEITKKHSSYPEIHYKYNSPYPIDFSQSSEKGVEFTSVDLKEFKENDLFSKLLTLSDLNRLVIFCLLIAGINLIGTIFIIAKLMGWLDKGGP